MSQKVEEGSAEVRAEMAVHVERLVTLTFEHGGSPEQTMLDLFEHVKRRFDIAKNDIDVWSRSVQSQLDKR